MLEFALVLLCWFLLMIFVPVAIHWIFDNVVSEFGGVATAWLAFLGLFTLALGLWVLVVWVCGYL